MVAYIVSGYGRCGTSMMMACLDAGGIEVLRSRDKHNLHELYEIEPFLQRAYHAERAYKVPRYGVERLPVADYIVIYMIREPAKVVESHRKFFESKTSEEEVDRVNKECLDYLQERTDCSVIVVRYEDVLSHPLSVMKALRAVGVSIDPDAAATVVDSTKCSVK